MRPFMVGMVMPLHAGARARFSWRIDPEAWGALDEHGLDQLHPRHSGHSLKLLRQQAAVAQEQGFYAAFGERNEDVGSISAPFSTTAGRLACALGLGFPTQRIGPADVAPAGARGGAGRPGGQ